MSTNKKRIIFVFLIFLLAGFFYLQQNKKESILNKTDVPEVSMDEKYIKFDLEVYDKISTIYWKKATDADLSGLFELSIMKAANTSTTTVVKDKKGVENILRSVLLGVKTPEEKKQIAVNTAMIALYNIYPLGRDQLLSQKQETQFRQTVANVNPTKDLYSDIGVGAGASQKEVQSAVEKKVDELSRATSTQDKVKLEKIKYAGKVLTNPVSKTLYDEVKAEPTLKFRTIGNTFYANLSQIAPTSLIELVSAIDTASTTKSMDTLIIDLRGNFGGALDFLPAFFGLFVGNDEYAFDLYKQGKKEPVRTTQPKYPQFDRFKEIAILTDNMTQSTAELTTATFKKFHMAKVVGRTTRGWGTIENTYPMETEIDPSEKYVLLLVNAVTLREDGQPIEGRGVNPDIDISNPAWQKELQKQFKSASLIQAIKTLVK